LRWFSPDWVHICDHARVTSPILRTLLAIALPAALAACTAPRPFELPGLDSRPAATTETMPPGSYPTYRHGYPPYAAYGYGYGYGYAYGQPRHGQPGSSQPPRDNPGTPDATPVPVVIEPPPPRPVTAEREPRETRGRAPRAYDDALPNRRQQER
jgi:hypothetical protein